jgi:O-antigen/teichoic acid export membrane protein
LPARAFGATVSTPARHLDKSVNGPTAIQPNSSLRSRLLRGASFEAIGYLGSQVVRLGGNLVLTRLLEPEAFGLATIVTLVNQGLIMFSDLGLLPALVQNRHGGDEPYVNTAWTLQVLQGVLLFLVALGISWPMARFYGHDELTLLIVVGSSGLVAKGFSSQARFTLRRHMRVGPLVSLELSTQLLGTLATVVMAVFVRSVWALVLGMVLSSVLFALFSYRLPADFPHRFVVDAKAKESILRVGKWVFWSSLVTFLSQQGDRLIVGKMVGVTDLGVYSVAVLLSTALSGAVAKVIQGVVFPALAEVKERGRAELKRAYYSIRKGLDLTVLPVLGVLCALSSLVVDLLYDPRFSDAGWMLELLVLRSALACILMPCQSALFAVGRVRYSLLEGAGRAAWLLVAMPVGFSMFGLGGLVVAVALSEVPVLLLLWPPFQQEKLLSLPSEARSVAAFGVGYGLAFLVRPPLAAWIH